MDPVEIKVIMLRRGLTQEKLAGRVEYTVSAVNTAINRAQGSDRLLKAIARELGKDPRELWPDRFTEREAA